MELMRELRSSNASAAVVGDLVAKDLAISTKLIQVANSAYYGADQQVSEPGAAVLLLGMETTASLVLSIEAFARFDKLKPLYFSIDRVWKHSQALADLTRKICQAVGCDAEMTGHAYTAGLLHDIGKLALAQNFEEQYHRTVKRAEDNNVPVYSIEREVFGATHPEAGAYLLAVWGLPLPIVRAVADHHLCPESFTSPFSASTAVHLAEQLIAGRKRPDEIVAAYPKEAGLLPHIVEICQLMGVTFDPNASQREEAVPPEETVTNTVSKRDAKTKALPVEEIDPRIVLRRLVLAALGVVLLIGITVGVWLGRRSETKLVAMAQPPAPSNVSIEKEEKAAPPAEKPQVAEIPTPKEPEFKLQAVLYNGEKSAAIINGVLLRIGDSVEGARVESIAARQVTLRQKNGERTLRLE
jgi:putative nucleotidyltransferase with HDIG domain